jgi:glutamate dehydrogenase
MNAILTQLKQRIEADAESSEVLRRFAEGLFGKAGQDFLNEFDAESLHAIALRGFEFLDGKAPDEVRVRVYNPTFQADGWEGNYTVLELTLSDRPFIVDSVRAELRRQEVELFYLLHPILEIKRDGAGYIQDVGRGGVPEAYELYFVERLSDEKCRTLERAVREVLGDVVLATDHYPAMRRKTRELHDYLAALREKSVKEGDLERAEELDEYGAFMAWLDQDNFVFLGYREYELFKRNEVQYLQLVADSGLGILSKLEQSAYQTPVPVSEIPEGLRERVTGGKILIVTKTNAESTVHRPARMDYIGLKKLDDKWQVQGEQRFVGLFTSKALSTPVEEIPILRRKLRQVLELDKAIPGSHDFKQIVSIFNSIPREELFWADAERLHKDIRTIMEMAQERGVRLTLRPDPLSRGLAVMVIMPRERFNAEVRRRIQKLLYEKLQATHVDYQLAMGEDEEQVRFHFFYTTALSYFDVDLAALEREVAELTRTWDDHLRERLIATKGEMAGRRLAERYARAFDERYKADTSSLVALRDIERLESLGERRYLVDIVNPVKGRTRAEATHLKIYHREQGLILSEVMPVLENLGFRVLEQLSYTVRVPGDHAETAPHVIDIFRVQDESGAVLNVREHGARLTAALTELLFGRAENDRLNRLVLYGSLDIRQVTLLRSYQLYYAQLHAAVSRSFINATLLAHPRIARLLVRAFEVRFSPTLDGDREAQIAAVREAFFDSLAEVSSLPEDRILRGLYNLIQATVRTNYFLNKPYLSFKLDPSLVESMPEPRPYREILVAAPGVEGVHLRGGKVARGGIRWSDRSDDFRTEVLGLMKTQMTKNAVIVPVGSKGGFIVKRPPEGREALRAYVEEQYKTYIRGLLDLTDNFVDGKVVHPEGLVIYDEADPYLVVAADKGTATFSDLANEIAAEYGFWLGDAFASGGTYGYDHKKEGITARGAWECVKRHFREMGVDIYQEPFTVVGIGDMSGDVFGNGMLYTDTIKLLAAFNHQHIFLDPNPDPAASYQERKRLFALPRSSWDDYDRSVISEGGGIYLRSAKAIALSPQVKAMLGVEADTLSGQDLIRAILCMEVDLLWNGGIGTYVKCSLERHAEVGDSSNDAVRVDASELRAKVVGEGGNLGFTQRARIEYALAGGRINTDAIDNSGGVDMSDHEVNIKILFEPLVRSGDLSFKQRNDLLRQMTDEVSALVLRNNYTQSLCLSLAQPRSRKDVRLFESLQEYLAERGGLKPEQEFLPNRRVYDERARSGEGLMRPELAILLAYAKMGIYRRLLETDFPDEPYFQHYLYEYFPRILAERFKAAIDNHPLKREIVATQFTNTVVDLLGITFVHRTLRDTGVTPVEVMRAALVALEIIDVKPFLEGVFALDNHITTAAQYRALSELVRAVEGIVHWILLSDLSTVPISAFIATYREPLAALRADFGALLPARERERYQARYQAAEAEGFPAELAALVATFDYLPSAVGVIEVARTASVPLEHAAKAFYGLGDRLALGWLRDMLAELPAEDKWEKIALGGLIMELRRTQRQLTVRYFEAKKGTELSPEAFLAQHPRLLTRFDQALGEIRAEENLSLASGEVLSRLLWQLVEEASRQEAA